jgi:hypothetical protein
MAATAVVQRPIEEEAGGRIHIYSVNELSGENLILRHPTLEVLYNARYGQRAERAPGTADF